MKSVGVYEAKSQLPKLLVQVEAGEQIAITRHGTPIAKLVPFAEQPKPSPREAMEEIRKLRGVLRMDIAEVVQMIRDARR
jgi:prevent-host-death family protein